MHDIVIFACFTQNSGYAHQLMKKLNLRLHSYAEIVIIYIYVQFNLW